MKTTMARTSRNSVFVALSGTIGRELVFMQYPNKVVVGKYPHMMGAKPTERQVMQRQKMKEATAYALSILNNSELKAAFEKSLQPGESLYRKAIQHYFQQLKTKK